MNVLDDLNYRGLIKDYSNEENVHKLLDAKQTIYCGFDPSAPSLHMGNFVMIATLKRLQNAGHRIIAIVGGATGMIGDPSGKSAERNLQDKETLERNVESIRKQLCTYLDFSDPSKGLILNNFDWIGPMTVIELLRDYGKYFNINYLLNKDIIASRLENGISFTEFTYNILQAIDFLHLYREYGCKIQIGGSDQWGNLTSGLELLRKAEKDPDAEAMTIHLLTRSDGKKFGKSEKGALFLDENKTSSYQLYQYFINVTDDDAIKYLKVFSFMSKDEIEEISREHYANIGMRVAQKKLAYEIVKIVRGEAKANEAVMMSEALFKGDVKSLTKEQLEEVLADLTFEISKDSLLEDALIGVGAAPSKREARTLVSQGAVTLNGDKAVDPAFKLDEEHSLFGTYYVIRRGKKLYYLAKIK